MERICVFCGKKPENKNREHILPKWLMKMTGDENRIGNWGIDYQGLVFEEEIQVNSRKYPFMKFAFPACEKCNAEYGDKLESKVKSVIEKMHGNCGLEEDEVGTLLDWFDKIRVGMWLGHLYYNSKDGIVPKFCINERVGACDRALFVFKSDCVDQGLTIFGPGSMLFSRFPIIMGMRINGYYYISISSDFLISNEVGFPIPSIIETNLEGNLGFESLLDGSQKITEGEIWRKFFSLKPEVVFLQPIYKKYYKYFPDVYETEYVKNNSLSIEKGIGKIFYYKNDKFEVFPKGETAMLIKGRYAEGILMKRVFMIVSKYLIKQAEKIQSELADERVDKEMYMAILYQKFLMKHGKENEFKDV